MEYGKPDTVIVTCNCPNEYQDATRGKNKRVANHAPSKGAHKDRYRCTSCLKEHTVR